MNGEITNDMILDFPPYEVEQLTKEDLLGDTVLNYLAGLEDSVGKVLAIERVKNKAKEFNMTTAFNKAFKLRDKEMSIAKKVASKSDKPIMFQGLEELGNLEYNTSRYEMDEMGRIYEIIPDVGRYLVCYHPIVPIEKYKNLEDGTEKIKIAFYKKNKWETLIVDKSMISSNQSIVKLSDFGIAVTSENAKFLVKYLAEVENMNEDKINTNISISRLGWFGNILSPYSNKYEFDNEKDMPYLKEKFGESGKLEDWIEFFKERRKFNNISRIVMAAGVASILLKDLKQPGFTVHVYGESEFRKNSNINGCTINFSEIHH